MGQYANSILAPGENVVYEGKMSQIIFILPVITFFLGMIIGVFSAYPGVLITAIGAIAWGCVYLYWKNSEYVITNRRIILKTGIISRHTFEMRLQKIESISFSQGILERMLNYGTIVITGTGDTSQAFKDISNPLRFKLMAEEEMEKRRES